MANPPLNANSNDPGIPAIVGEAVGTALLGHSTNGPGVSAESDHFDACIANCHSATNSAVAAVNNAGGFGVRGLGKRGVVGESVDADGIGIFGKGPRAAGFFEGNVQVTGDFRGDHVIANKIDCNGDIKVTGVVDVIGDVRLVNGDCAEDFDIAEICAIDAGTVMVLDDTGKLTVSKHAYDRRVVGVISGAGMFKPGIVLDHRETDGLRQPVGLLGKVFCKVDAQSCAIAVGDLLTTSPTPGHAMATNDPIRSFGAVIGKALQPFEDGQGVIPILITLQ